LWTGVAVSQEGRIFVNFPRWSPEVDVSVVELLPTSEVKPYPDEEWNRWSPDLLPQEHFICVQSVYIDAENFLWILDPANPLLQGVVEGGAKLLKVDLATGKMVQKIFFDNEIAPSSSYLNDIRVDVKHQFAYLTDSGLGAIIVVDLNSGKARRLLDNHPSTKAEDITLTVEGIPLKIRVHSDGLALNPERSYLYYQALSGRTLYRVETKYLKDPGLTAAQIGELVEFVTESGASDAIEFDHKGNLYLTSLEYNAIRRLTPAGIIETVVKDSSLKWPDSFSIPPEGAIYVTTSQLHLGAAVTEPYKIFKIIY